jgi:hypothetical protein
MYLLDACALLTSNSCTDTELIWERVVTVSLVYVGVVVSQCIYDFVSCLISDIEILRLNLTLSLHRRFFTGPQFAVLTYHSKQSIAKITRLSNFALNGAIALLVSVVFTGNASFTGGLKPSWMHKVDMLGMIVLVCVLSARVAKVSVCWFFVAQNSVE